MLRTLVKPSLPSCAAYLPLLAPAVLREKAMLEIYRPQDAISTVAPTRFNRRSLPGPSDHCRNQPMPNAASGGCARSKAYQ